MKLENEDVHWVDMMQVAMIPIAITKSHELSTEAKLVYGVIHARAWAPLISTVSRSSAISLNSTKKAVNELVRHKLIELDNGYCFRLGQARGEREHE